MFFTLPQKHSQYIESYKCSKNKVLPFLPGVFRLDQENRLHCNVVSGNDVLGSFFPGVKPVLRRLPLVNALSNPAIDAYIKQDLRAIIPDNHARPTGTFSFTFDPQYVKSEAQPCQFVADFYAIINEHGFDSHYTIREFTRLLFQEYFLSLPDNLFVDPKVRPTIHWLSYRNHADRLSKPVFAVTPFVKEITLIYPTDQRLAHILPFFAPTARPKMFAALKMKGWHKLGLRSFWIQLFMHAQSTHPQVTR